jgi:hypothetical protein
MGRIYSKSRSKRFVIPHVNLGFARIDIGSTKRGVREKGTEDFLK